MSAKVFWDAIKALPILIKLCSNVWEYIHKVSGGRPEQLLVELHDISEEMKNAESTEERQAVARRLSGLWAGRVSDKKTPKNNQ